MCFLCRSYVLSGIQGRPDYLQYVLALAFYLRVGASDEFPKPTLPRVIIRRELIVDEFKRLSKHLEDEDILR